MSSDRRGNGMERDRFLEEIGERVDRLISLDVPSRNVIGLLYAAARGHSDSPLCLAAAKLLEERVRTGDVVFIATGWPDRPHVTPAIAETDGPIGAAVLARALHVGLGAVPIVVIEDQLVAGMSAVVQAGGLRVLTPDQAVAAAASSAPIHAGAVTGFPTAVEAAQQEAARLVSRHKPSAVVVIEKGGINERGTIHTSRGSDTSTDMAKVDYLVLEAARHGIATIGVGDGGNEVGMGTIHEELRRSALPYAQQCRCGCGGGIVPVTSTDVLVTACISNWGAYGVAACLAALLGRREVLHDARMEEDLLRAAAGASFIDGVTGYVMPPGADGLPFYVHQAFVTLLGQVVSEGLRFLEKGSLLK
ncbi:MAG: glutamate cyclase domain-containing protein [Chloroflexota bacterium]